MPTFSFALLSKISMPNGLASAPIAVKGRNESKNANEEQNANNDQNLNDTNSIDEDTKKD